MNIEDFNTKCCEILKNINKKDGLYDYYQNKINCKEILNNDDQLLAEYFINNVNKNSNMLEIAAGIGQLSHYLNLNGFNNITGEWGHNQMTYGTNDKWNRHDCYCGKKGCIETYLSGPGLSKHYYDAIKKCNKVFNT